MDTPLYIEIPQSRDEVALLIIDSSYEYSVQSTIDSILEKALLFQQTYSWVYPVWISSIDGMTIRNPNLKKPIRYYLRPGRHKISINVKDSRNAIEIVKDFKLGNVYAVFAKKQLSGLSYYTASYKWNAFIIDITEKYNMRHTYEKLP